MTAHVNDKNAELRHLVQIPTARRLGAVVPDGIFGAHWARNRALRGPRNWVRSDQLDAEGALLDWTPPDAIAQATQVNGGDVHRMLVYPVALQRNRTFWPQRWLDGTEDAAARLPVIVTLEAPACGVPSLILRARAKHLLLNVPVAYLEPWDVATWLSYAASTLEQCGGGIASAGPCDLEVSWSIKHATRLPVTLAHHLLSLDMDIRKHLGVQRDATRGRYGDVVRIYEDMPRRLVTAVPYAVDCEAVRSAIADELRAALADLDRALGSGRRALRARATITHLRDNQQWIDTVVEALVPYVVAARRVQDYLDETRALSAALESVVERRLRARDYEAQPWVEEVRREYERCVQRLATAEWGEDALPATDEEEQCAPANA